MLKVLVVEDEPYVRRGIVLSVDWTALDCFVVGEAANGEEGYDAALKFQPNIIITDIRMPKMDGIEMLKRLREAGCKSEVIILTAYSDFEYAQNALHYGAADYLLKPFHDGELEQVIVSIHSPHGPAGQRRGISTRPSAQERGQEQVRNGVPRLHCGSL